MIRTFLLTTALLAAAPASSDTCDPALDPASIRELAALPQPSPVSKLALSPDGSVLAVSSPDAPLVLVRLQPIKQIVTQIKLPSPRSLVFAPDGSELWLFTDGRGIQRVDPKTGRVITTAGVWSTSVGSIQIEMPSLGQLALTGPNSAFRLPGRLVTMRGGVLQVDGGIFVAQRPDGLLRYDGKRLFGQDQGAAVAVGAMAVACGGRCLLTAADSSADETFLWRLAPFRPQPTRLPGQVFLDRGEAAIDCNGRQALLRSGAQIVRLALPDGIGSGARAAVTDGAHLRLSGDGRLVYLHDDKSGWRILDAATMRVLPRPEWLTDDAWGIIAPGGRFALFAEAEQRLHLTSSPYRSIARIAVDHETALPRFSATGGMLALRTPGGFLLYRSADGGLLGELPGSELLFDPTDRRVISIGEHILIYQVILRRSDGAG